MQGDEIRLAQQVVKCRRLRAEAANYVVADDGIGHEQVHLEAAHLARHELGDVAEAHQAERLAGMQLDLAEYKASYQLTGQRLAEHAPNAVVMHPGPIIRGLELTAGVAGLVATALIAAAPAHAEDTVKIGLIMTYSGQFADVATMMDNAIKLYMKQHGDTVAGKKIELIRKDSGAGGTAPDVAKRLAQELVVRDKVDIIAGFSLTPEALAAAER